MKPLLDVVVFGVSLAIFNATVGHVMHDYGFWNTLTVAQVAAVVLFITFTTLSEDKNETPRQKSA